MVANKLTSHTQLLASAESTDGVLDRNQLALADKNEPAAQPGLTPDTEEPVQARQGAGVSKEPPQPVEPDTARSAQDGQVQRKLLRKFATISGYTRSLANLVLCVKKDTHQMLLMLRLWWFVLKLSQKLFPIKNCRQMLLTNVRGVWGTKNRMSPGQLDSHINLASN